MIVIMTSQISITSFKYPFSHGRDISRAPILIISQFSIISYLLSMILLYIIRFHSFFLNINCYFLFLNTKNVIECLSHLFSLLLLQDPFDFLYSKLHIFCIQNASIFFNILMYAPVNMIFSCIFYFKYNNELEYNFYNVFL